MGEREPRRRRLPPRRFRSRQEHGFDAERSAFAIVWERSGNFRRRGIPPPAICRGPHTSRTGQDASGLCKGAGPGGPGHQRHLPRRAAAATARAAGSAWARLHFFPGSGGRDRRPGIRRAARVFLEVLTAPLTAADTASADAVPATVARHRRQPGRAHPPPSSRSRRAHRLGLALVTSERSYFANRSEGRGRLRR